MQRQRFLVRIKGVTPLLHHKMTDECIMGLLGDKAAKKKVKNYETPREIAEKHAYANSKKEFCIPTSYVTNALIHIASDYKQKNSQRKSYKSVLGGLFMPEEELSVLKDEQNKPIKDFEVDIRKATNFQAGAVAVCRPRFDKWETEFTVKLHTDLITPETTLAMLNDAGIRSGIGSFRVSNSGWFGQFQVVDFKPIA